MQGALQTRRLSFLQSGFEAITIALCIVLQEQRLWSRWFADGEDQEVHSTSDSPQNHRQNLAYIPLVNQIPPGRFRADLGSLWSPVPDCRCLLGKLNNCPPVCHANGLKYRLAGSSDVTLRRRDEVIDCVLLSPTPQPQTV